MRQARERLAEIAYYRSEKRDDLHEVLTSTALLEIGRLFGTSVMVLVMGMLAVKWWGKSSASKTEKDRREHMQKWRDMIDQSNNAVAQMTAQHGEAVKQMINSHRAEMDRMFILHERNASSIEYMGSKLTEINEAVENNQYCPLVREHTHGKPGNYETSRQARTG